MKNKQQYYYRTCMTQTDFSPPSLNKLLAALPRILTRSEHSKKKENNTPKTSSFLYLFMLVPHLTPVLVLCLI